MTQRQRQYRVTGLVMFLVAVSTVAMRVVSYFVSAALPASMDPALADTLMDLIFTVPLQVGFLFLMPLLIYRYGLKKSWGETFGFSNFKKVNIVQILLSVLLGVVSLFATIGISTVWQSILIMFGYTPYASGSVLPETFNFGWFVLAIFLTGVLPGFCEEFTNRGGFLTTIRGSFGENTTIILVGLTFGLFHQNITQLFYPMIFGAIMAYLVLKTGSIFPAMIVHFTSNTASLFLDYADAYGWKFGGGFYDWLSDLMGDQKTFLLVFVGFALVLCLTVFLAKIIPRMDKKREHAPGGLVEPARILYMPTARDNVWFTAAIVVSVLSTVFTWMFGLML